MGTETFTMLTGQTVTIKLTPTQKQELAKQLGLNWDEVTFTRPVAIAKGQGEGGEGKDEKKLKGPLEVNIVVAMGQTYTIS